MSKEAMKPAPVQQQSCYCPNCEVMSKELAELKKHKPVAWMDADGNFSDNNDHRCFPIPLYTISHPTPPAQRKPLTDEKIRNLWDGHVVPVFGKNGINPIVFARAIEAAHGIKENT